MAQFRARVAHIHRTAPRLRLDDFFALAAGVGVGAAEIRGELDGSAILGAATVKRTAQVFDQWKVQRREKLPASAV